MKANLVQAAARLAASTAAAVARDAAEAAESSAGPFSTPEASSDQQSKAVKPVKRSAQAKKLQHRRSG